jgi:hypothetical protein
MAAARRTDSVSSSPSVARDATRVAAGPAKGGQLTAISRRRVRWFRLGIAVVRGPGGDEPEAGEVDAWGRKHQRTDLLRVVPPPADCGQCRSRCTRSGTTLRASAATDDQTTGGGISRIDAGGPSLKSRRSRETVGAPGSGALAWSPDARAPLGKAPARQRDGRPGNPSEGNHAVVPGPGHPKPVGSRGRPWAKCGLSPLGDGGARNEAVTERPSATELGRRQTGVGLQWREQHIFASGCPFAWPQWGGGGGATLAAGWSPR